jgi:hypothetical protein
MRGFSEPKTAAVVGEAEFIGWVAAYANEHAKPPWTSDWKLGESPPGRPDARGRSEYGEVSSLREVFS